MRYITDSTGHLTAVSLGASISCGGQDCAEYTGAVPTGYASLLDWLDANSGSLGKWQVIDGNLVEDADVVLPEDPEEGDPASTTDVLNAAQSILDLYIKMKGAD